MAELDRMEVCGLKFEIENYIKFYVRFMYIRNICCITIAEYRN